MGNGKYNCLQYLCIYIYIYVFIYIYIFIYIYVYIIACIYIYIYIEQQIIGLKMESHWMIVAKIIWQSLEANLTPCLVAGTQVLPASDVQTLSAQHGTKSTTATEFSVGFNGDFVSNVQVVVVCDSM